MGKKYIIELEDKPLCAYDEDTHTYFPRLFRVKGFNSLVFDQNGLDKLTPYTPNENKNDSESCKFNVGDVVTDGITKCVVIDRFDNDHENDDVDDEDETLLLFTENGWIEEFYKSMLYKTGEHFDDIDKILEKLRGKQ